MNSWRKLDSSLLRLPLRRDWPCLTILYYTYGHLVIFSLAVIKLIKGSASSIMRQETSVTVSDKISVCQPHLRPPHRAEHWYSAVVLLTSVCFCFRPVCSAAALCGIAVQSATYLPLSDVEVYRQCLFTSGESILLLYLALSPQCLCRPGPTSQRSSRDLNGEVSAALVSIYRLVSRLSCG